MRGRCLELGFHVAVDFSCSSDAEHIRPSSAGQLVSRTNLYFTPQYSRQRESFDEMHVSLSMEVAIQR
jgi:hypothetical protein